jgi:hypothetical protein
LVIGKLSEFATVTAAVLSALVQIGDVRRCDVDRLPVDYDRRRIAAAEREAAIVPEHRVDAEAAPGLLLQADVGDER